MKRGRLNLNKTGYTKGTPTEDNDYNIIPSNRISMQNVDKNIIAIPVDSDGKIMDTKVMKPGDEELFEGADFVIETPEKPELVAGAAAAALGGKAAAAGGLKGMIGSNAGSFIMNNPNLLSKISQEKKDKFPNNPALIGGMGMGNMMMYGGKKKKAQEGLSGNQLPYGATSPFSEEYYTDPQYQNNDNRMRTQDVLEKDLDQVFGEQEGFNLDPETISNFKIPQTGQTPKMTSQEIINKDLNKEFNQDGFSLGAETISYMDIPYTSDTEQTASQTATRGKGKPKNEGYTGYKENDPDLDGKVGEVSDEEYWRDVEERAKQLTKDEEGEDEEGEDLDLNEKKKKILNPYGGVDIPTAFNKFGAAIESGDTATAIAAGAKSLLGAARNIGTGMGLQKRAENVQEGAMEDEKERIKGEYKEGGKASEMLTGDYSGEQEKANAEAEGGEYRKDEQGNVTEIKGDKHSNGGVEVSLEKQEEILTDHTKLKGSLAKEIRNNFDIDVKAKNTYSDVIDKYRSKSGLKKLSKEEEKVIEKLDKVVTKLKKDPEDNTQQLNKQFLQNKINEITKKKEPLKKQETQLFSLLFQAQESNKNKNSDNLSKNKLVQKLRESNGLSDEDAKQAIKAEFGLDGMQIDQINKALEMYQGIPQEALDQAMENDPSLTVNQAKAKVSENVNNEIDLGLGNMMMYGGKKKKAQPGTKGEDVETDAERFYRKTRGAWEGSNNLSEFSTGLFRAYGQYMDGLDPMEDLKNIGTDIFNAVTGNSSTGTFNDEPEWEGARILQSPVTTDSDGNPLIQSDFFGQSPLPTGELMPEMNYQTSSVEGTGYTGYKENDPDLDGKVGEVSDEEYWRDVEERAKQLTKDEEGEDEAPNKEAGDNKGSEEEEEKDEMYIPNLPNQMPLPPRGMQAHLMTDFDAERMDAPYIDPANAISEARRSEMQMEEQLRGLPASQRIAAMANITAQTQNQKNKILSDINRANMEAQMKTRQANAQASDQEEMMDQKSALSYEKRQMTADAKTEANLRGFYNHLNDLNTVNYNTIQNMNLANQLGDDYFFNPQTGRVEQVTNNKLTDTKQGRGRKAKKNKKN